MFKESIVKFVLPGPVKDRDVRGTFAAELDESETEAIALKEDVAALCARNIKMPPYGEPHFIATSGQSLSYLINVSTNFLDRRVASRIAELMTLLITKTMKDLGLDKEERVIMIGPECAGGVLVGQLAGMYGHACYVMLCMYIACSFVYMLCVC